MTDTPNPGALADRLKPQDPVIEADDYQGAVEEALGRLEALPDLPVTDHVSVFEGVQQRLSEILSNVDDV
ncbi:hypothetical protein K3N28_00420 [Glycomyces sp. TRM65418]|uniref:hypothetical protein n=1 Tax=Glycomyces sp. TRM65418 TaxID=2867006 RepID=UPI001CE5548B|nr:hypothetical protein [Glycomyces sp. TRM65418]MCC3761542.1 hypothetical protein [Glycomyces sp. TRM65418]QZD55639.1 hypothetical protein K3N28_00415 [Glycomyces sp. TRM65418]